jgi:hypothetical protein
MAELGYQNPTISTDSKLDSTVLNPGDASGVEVRRENVQIFSTSEDRQMRQMDSLFQSDQCDLSAVRRHTERFSPMDRRGGCGRGSTR